MSWKLIKTHWRSLPRLVFMFFKLKYASWKNARKLRREVERMKKAIGSGSRKGGK